MERDEFFFPFLIESSTSRVDIWDLLRFYALKEGILNSLARVDQPFCFPRSPRFDRCRGRPVKRRHAQVFFGGLVGWLARQANAPTNGPRAFCQSRFGCVTNRNVFGLFVLECFFVRVGRLSRWQIVIGEGGRVIRQRSEDPIAKKKKSLHNPTDEKKKRDPGTLEVP